MCTNLEESSEMACGVPSRCQKSLKYHLEIKVLKQAMHKIMLLGISEQYLLPLRKKIVVAIFFLIREAAITPSSVDEKNRIRQQIAAFPTVESLYCRKDSQSMYLRASMESSKCNASTKKEEKRLE